MGCVSTGNTPDPADQEALWHTISHHVKTHWPKTSQTLERSHGMCHHERLIECKVFSCWASGLSLTATYHIYQDWAGAQKVQEKGCGVQKPNLIWYLVIKGLYRETIALRVLYQQIGN